MTTIATKQLDNYPLKTSYLMQGEVLFSEGDVSDYIYYVHKGCLEAFTTGVSGSSSLGKIHAGEFVGEIGVLQNTVRSASVVAVENTEIQWHTKDSFIGIISRNPEKSVKILYSLSVRVRNFVLLNSQISEQIAGHKYAYSLNPVQSLVAFGSRTFKWIKRLIQSREYKQYPRMLVQNPDNGIYKLSKNTALFYEGEASNFAARLLTGRLRAIKTSGLASEHIGFIEKGDFVGELGLLEVAPRSLTVIATEDSEIEVFHEDTFLRLISSDAQSITDLINRLSLRAINLSQTLKIKTKKHTDNINASTLSQARQLLESIGDVSQLTGNMLVKDLLMLKNALKQESLAVQGMVEVYYRFVAGNASKEEMDLANAEFRNFLKTLGLGALVVIPGSFITIPLIVKMSKTLGVNILPKSRPPQ